MNDKHLPAILSGLSLFMLLIVLIFGSNAKAQETNRRIMFLSDHEGSTSIYTMRADGTDIQRFTDVIFEEGGVITGASLSPDGTTLAVSSRKERSLDYFADEIFLLDITTDTITMLTNDGRNNTMPNWSPDSQHLAYLTGNGVNGFDTVHIADFDSPTIQIRVLVTARSLNSVISGDFGPVIRWLDWSPDGSQLALAGQTGLPDVFNMLIVVNADGTNAHQVTPNEMHVIFVSWRFDSNSIYMACSNNYTDNEICRLNLQTLQIERISNLATVIPNASHPIITSLDISPEGEIIFGYGEVRNAPIYQFDVSDGSVNFISSVTGDNYELLGWVDIPSGGSSNIGGKNMALTGLSGFVIRGWDVYQVVLRWKK